SFGSNVSPRLYGVYNLSTSWTLKGGVSTGYKTPKTTDLFNGITGFGGQGTIPFAGNPDLQPEKSVSSELALYWESMAGGHNFNITVFNNDFEDKIETGTAVQTCSATNGAKPCVNLGEYEDLGYDEYSQKINIDEARVRGVEVAGRWQVMDALTLRGNYTYTDSEQLSGAEKGQPLTNSAEHMSNITLSWDVTHNVNVFLTNENRSDRFRGVDENDKALFYKDYNVLHLGASYNFSENLSIYGRVNNLLDEDFTTYSVTFDDKDGDGQYEYVTGRNAAATNEVIYTDDYNNKDKRRNFWVGLNYKF